MNTAELDSYSLDDAVKFNRNLNPRLWHKQRMRPDVRAKLLEIAADFKQSLGLTDLEVKDITVSGSNAGFTYTPHSDIDLHLVVDIPQADISDVYRELFDAKKYQYNAEHNITIGGYDVELYVENANQPPVSQGVYSVMRDDWINIPKRRRSTVNDDAVRSKYADIKHRIQTAIDSRDHEQISAMAAKIKKMRTAGLASSGEMGPENLAYKMLRAQGWIKKLYDAKTAARDLELSLNERKKKKKRVRYAYGGYWAPGFSFGDSEGGGDGGGGGESVQEVSVTPDGVSPSTKMFLEQDSTKDINILKSFAKYVGGELGLAKMPKIIVKRRPDWAEQNGSFGQYVPELNQLTLSLHGRHIVDVLRTLAHELTHAHQQQTTGIPDNGGETGSDFENEANARAGEFMRHFADAHPEYFDTRTLEEGMIKNAGAAVALAAAMAMTPAQAQQYLPQDQQQQVQQQGQLSTMQILNIARTIHSLKHNLTRAGAEEEINQEVKNYLRAQQGDAGAQNLSRLWQLQQRQQQRQQPQQQPWTGNQYQREDIAEASGYIPTAAEKNDPRFVMALSPDVKPGATGKNANKMALKTDAQGRPQIAKANGLVESMMREFANYQPVEDLLEVRMSTANLRQLAAKTGALAGMEFEMIVPNTETDVEPEYEPDYDQDQRARSFSDVRDFFHDGDYNSRRDADRLIEEIDEEYEEWKMDQTAEAWARDGADFMRDYVSLNDLFDRDEAMAQARDEIIDANPDLPQESEEFTELLSARLNEMETEFADTEFEARGRIHDAAFEAFAEEQREEYDEGSFLDDKYPYMTDIQNNFDISWPHYYDINDGQDGELDIDQVADDFSNSIGKPVNASRSYHGARREDGHYVVEPDGSLEGDNPGDGGLEFVSPPMPIDEMMSDLNKVKAWAKREGCYTNDSTGLHINISVPDYSLEKLDYVKLALLMGDEYVLDLFGRSGNTYAKAATDKIRTALKKNPDLAPAMMDKMRDHMEDLATKAIHSGTTEKYTSINTKTGYIEFRSPGGDWLDANFDKIENTLLRFTVALSAAIDPQAYRQEYLKKLYKLLESSQVKGGVDVVQLFSNYSAGELDKAALIRQVREKQLARDLDKGKIPPGQKYWWDVSRPGYFASVEVVASNKEEAIAKAVEPGNYPDWASARNTLQAKPLRPYKEPQPSLSYSVYDARAGYNRSSITASSQEDAVQKFRQFVSGENNPNDFSLVDRAGTVVARGGDPQPPTLNGRPSNPDGNWIIVDRRAPTTPVYRFMASGDRDALLVLRQWIEANRESGVEWNFAPDANQRMGQPRPQSAAQPSTDNWGIWIVPSNRFARVPNTIVADNVLRRFPSREAAEQFLTRTREENPQMRTDIEVREIEPAAGEFRSTENVPREGQPRNLVPTGPGPWEIYRISDNSSVRELSNTSRPEAEQEARSALGLRGEAPELYGVRTRQSDAQAPQTLTRPGQDQQTFTGEWQVVDPEGREIYRFSGVGNNQGDANRVAMDWLRRNPQRMQAGVEVLPVMG